MAVTISDVTADPNQGTVYGLPWKFALKDVTFDGSYPTGGETVTAAQVGLNMLVGAWPAWAANADGTLGLPVYVKVNSTGSEATLFAYGYDGSEAGAASLEEKGDTFDADAFTARVMFYGH